MNPCPEHDRMMDYLVSTEAQYGEIKKDLNIIKNDMNDIKTKLAIIDSHNLIDKVDKLEVAIASTPSASQYAPYVYKIIMALILIVGGVVGVKIAF